MVCFVSILWTTIFVFSLCCGHCSNLSSLLLALVNISCRQGEEQPQHCVSLIILVLIVINCYIMRQHHQFPLGSWGVSNLWQIVNNTASSPTGIAGDQAVGGFKVNEGDTMVVWLSHYLVYKQNDNELKVKRGQKWSQKKLCLFSAAGMCFWWFNAATSSTSTLFFVLFCMLEGAPHQFAPT